MFNEKINEDWKCIKNCDQTLENEEDWVAEHSAIVDGHVGVVLLKLYCGSKDFTDSKYSY